MKTNEFNPRYTFGKFEVTPGNKFAYGVLQSMLDSTPIVIVGKSGSGKTHLLHAVGNELYDKVPNIIYMKARDVLSDEESVDNQDNEIQTYIDCEILLIDDLDEIYAHTPEQNVIAQIINARWQNKRTTIITSRIYPDKLIKQNKALSCLEYGVMTDIK